MTDFYYEKPVKKSYIRHLFDSFAREDLRKRAAACSKIRGGPIAVFGNDWIGININTTGVYELDYLECCFEFIQEKFPDMLSGTALDIGANIGNHSIYFLKHYDNVISFEPNPVTYGLLSFNLGLYEGAKAYNYGLGDKEETLLMHVPIDNAGGASFGDVDTQCREIQGSIKILDDLDFIPDNVNLMKIDVEGFESNVLRGARNVIMKNRPIIFFEQNIEAFADNGKSEAVTVIQEMDYSLFWFNKGKSRSFIMRRVMNIFELFTGRLEKYQIISGDDIKPDTYDFIIAIPTERVDF